MKNIHLTLFILAIFNTIAFGQNYGNASQQGNPYYQSQAYQQPQAYQQFPAYNITKPAGQLITHTIKNPKTGKISGTVQLPNRWKITDKDWASPNGARAEVRKGGSFTSPQYVPQSVDQIIQQQLNPQLQQYGARVTGIIDLPQIAQHNKAIYDLYWKVMPTQDLHQTRGIELVGKDGKPGIIVVHFLLTQSQYGAFAYYYMHTLSGESATGFQNEKNAFLYALATTGVDRQAVALHNQREQQRSQASWAAHNSRMRANQRNFDGWQKASADLSSVNDIYFETWKNKNQIEDRMQQKTVNGIWEQSNVVNPHNGQTNQVQNGYKYYYVNSYGQYYGTNDEFYNPANDPNVNHMGWKKAQRPNNN